MKRYLFISLLLILGLSACKQKDANNKEIIVCSLSPYSYLISEITGDDFEVISMIDEGILPSAYEPQAESLEKIKNASVFFSMSNYISYENRWKESFLSINSDLQFIDITEGCKVIGTSCDHDHDIGHQHNNNADPHLWLSVNQTRTIMENVYNELCLLYPDYVSEFEHNYIILTERFNTLEHNVTNRLSEHSGSKIVIYHPALGYLLNDFGIEQLSLENDGKEASAESMINIINTIKTDSIHTIFIQKEYDISNVQIIVEQTNCKVVVIDPLAFYWFENIDEISIKIQKALNDE